MIRTQITELDELAGATIESAKLVHARYTRGDILLLLDRDRYAIVLGSAGDYPDDDPYPYLDTDGLPSLFRANLTEPRLLVELGLVTMVGLEDVGRQTRAEEEHRAQAERERDLATLARLKERYE